VDRIGLLSLPAHTKDAQALFDEDQEELGYVMNVSRLWAYQPGTVTALFELMGQTLASAGFSPRQRGILVCAAASSLGDSYCSLAWGSKLAKSASSALAAAVISVFVALRLAFSTVNDALGATPDAQLRRDAPLEVAAAVNFGRPADAGPGAR
jgi:hypothetical protein